MKGPTEFRHPILLFSLILVTTLMFCPLTSMAQNATVREYTQTFLTYPFEDPNPVARTGKIYPYYRFDGFTTKAVDRVWKIVELENDWIRVLVAPEMGGKILGAFEKSTGKDFIYFNKVIKFRDIAMRGAWTSGGIEFNFGSIGHAPTTATPVDYLTRANSDGSVSCFIGAMDLTSRTEWRVEIRLPKDKAWFETHISWSNPTDLSTSRYQWSNAAADASSDLTYYYPGDHFIGHDGEASPWPILPEGRNISHYAENNYGADHSYHVLGAYTDWFAGIYGSRDFGFGHYNDYTEKPGKKIWIWALSPQGAIWTDLLTDQPGNGQYTEIQTGLLFNQAAAGSTYTPFKHMDFPGNTSERFTECWFPVVGTGGVTDIGKAGILFVNDGKSTGPVAGKPGEIRFCPLENLNDTLEVTTEEGVIRVPVNLHPLQTFIWQTPGKVVPSAIRLVHGGLDWSVEDQEARITGRPVESPPFDWTSVQGLFMKATEFSRQREYSQARDYFRRCLTKDPHYLPALTGMAEEYIRILHPELAAEILETALSYDTYDPKANYLLGVVRKNDGPGNRKSLYQAREAFGIATRSMEYRSAALTGLAEIALMQKDWDDAIRYANGAQDYDRYNPKAIRVEAIAQRMKGEKETAMKTIRMLEQMDPLSHFAGFEQYLLDPSQANLDHFQGLIRNEFPEQTYLELAIFYHDHNLDHDASRVLEQAPDGVETGYWKAYLNSRLDPEDSVIPDFGNWPTQLVFPYRPETLPVLEWAEAQKPTWQNRYYMGLIYWSIDDSLKARELFKSCRNEPVEYAFYLSRAKLFEGLEEELVLHDLDRAHKLQPGEWRTWHALGEYYQRHRGWAQFLDNARKATAAIPGHMILEFDQAKAELYNMNPGKCLDILRDMVILPNEGAREGHEIYRSAHILSALEYIRHQRYLKALADLDEAREWPENLGVGKPYATDERIEDYLTGICYLQMNAIKVAAGYFNKVIDYTTQTKPAWDSPYVLAALSYKLINREKDGDRLLTNWMKEIPTSPLMMWAVASYTGNQAAAQKALGRLGRVPEETPWKIGDQQLALVFEIIKQVAVK
jgi:tetratricopeptide (TPR) repeat protein